MPNITVVMATYKQAKWLPEAIESIIIRNRFPGCKLIIAYAPNHEWRGVNHKGNLAAQKLVDKNGTIVEMAEWRWKPNMWEQREFGLKHIDPIFKHETVVVNDKKYSRMEEVGYPYVTFFDSDDVMLPGWLEKGLKVAMEIASRGKVPIVGPSYRMVDEQLRPLQDVILPEFSLDKMLEGCIIPDFSITRTQELRVAFEAGCKVARKLFTPQYSCYCSWLEMLTRFDCEVKLLPDIGFLYRQHRGGMHNRFKRSKRASRRNVNMIHKVAEHYFPEVI